jgi:hypothetical protein
MNGLLFMTRSLFDLSESFAKVAGRTIGLGQAIAFELNEGDWSRVNAASLTTTL